MNLSLRRERSEILVAPFSKMLLSLEKALRKHPFLSQETNGFETLYPRVIDTWFEILGQESPMTRFSLAVSTTSFVTT
jgi:hypothetical protein